MEQQDYLMRQIDQLGVVLRKILSKLLGLKDDGALSAVAVDQVFTEELGMDVDRLNNIEIDTLMAREEFNAENLEKLADILLFAAENADLKGKERLYRKCLTIYEYLDESTGTYSFDRSFKMKKIRFYIND